MIPTFIINLQERKDRKKHILDEFYLKPEFNITIVNAFHEEIGALGLWKTIKHILSKLVKSEDKYILICEDDHQFTKHYSTTNFSTYIEKAIENNADILLGGVSSLKSIINISDSLLWIEDFTGLQFIIIFKKFFNIILNESIDIHDQPDHKISYLSKNKFLIFPFISVQKEFGYSDITYLNNEKGRVTDLFKQSSNAIQYILDGQSFYQKKIFYKNLFQNEYNNENFAIPVYVINLSERTERLEHIRNEFKGKSEFIVKYIKAYKHKIGAVGLWKSIRKIITIAIQNDEDVIIICEDDHEFTSTYSFRLLLDNIIEAHLQGADILSGGINNGFSFATVITENRFWINHFFGTQFIVIYKKFFNKLLNEPFDNKVTADDFLSTLTSNKMVIYPFISQQKYFGYSDVSIAFPGESFGHGFTIASNRLNNILNRFNSFNETKNT